MPSIRRASRWRLGFEATPPDVKHRGFAEASLCQVGILSDPEHPSRFYGPCGQLGYQFVSRGGFTALLSVGIGYAVRAMAHLNRAQGLLGLGLGYTWRRK